ncbi:MAG: hypothetical protein HN368_15630 [Spirochaetales bacterium]|nr:hypothetical protein [Spirochaetales bacterium]
MNIHPPQGSDKSGVVGTPIYATAKLGETLWLEVVDSVVITLKRITENSDLSRYEHVSRQHRA